MVSHMSVIDKQSSADRFILQDVSWATYESLLKDLGDRRWPRLTYDRGILEIMSPHSEHEGTSWILASIVDLTLVEQDIDSCNVGMTTFRSVDQKRGFQPDSSFYIKNAARVRGKKVLDMAVDPPPDLLIEIDVSNDSLNKFPLFASFGVPEVWRFAETLEIWILDRGKYVRQTVSRAIPILDEKLVSELLQAGRSEKRPTWVRQARNRIRARIQGQG